MKASKCGKTEALARAFPRRDDPSLARHLLDCESCQSEWQSLQGLRALGQALPVEQPSPERRDAVRARLLYQAEQLRREGLVQPVATRPLLRRPATAIFAGLALCLLLGAVAWWSPQWNAPSQNLSPSPRQPAGSSRPRGELASLHPLGDADFQRSQQGGVELVHLRHGRLELAVRPLAPGERFVVAVGRSEVEVRGTRFTVTAEHDRLAAVYVTLGHVEVRPADQAAVQLKAGQGWTAENILPTEQPPGARAAPPETTAPVHPSRRADAPTASGRGELTGTRSQTGSGGAHPVGPNPLLPSTGSRAAAAPAPSSPSPLSSAALGSPAERAFKSGFAALKLGRFAEAASELDRAVQLSPGGNLAEDARFWASVSWARAGKNREATTRMRGFLLHHPASPRAAEVGVALGWLLIRERRFDEAETVLRGAGHPRSPEVAESLRSGLATIERSRTAP